MKYLLYIVLFGTCTVFALNVQTKQEKQTIDAMVGSHYTGCMSGIIAVIEEGLFKAGKNKIEAYKNFTRIQNNCRRQQSQYKKLLNNRFTN